MSAKSFHTTQMCRLRMRFLPVLSVQFVIYHLYITMILVPMIIFQLKLCSHLVPALASLFIRTCSHLYPQCRLIGPTFLQHHPTTAPSNQRGVHRMEGAREAKPICRAQHAKGASDPLGGVNIVGGAARYGPELYDTHPISTHSVKRRKGPRTHLVPSKKKKRCEACSTLCRGASACGTGSGMFQR